MTRSGGPQPEQSAGAVVELERTMHSSRRSIWVPLVRQTAHQMLGRLRLALIVPLGFSLIWVACAINTAPFLDSRGQRIPGSVAMMTDATIGGVEQRLWFRGVDATQPALLILHGGPGASEAALFRHFNADLERSFLMISWEQRGTGRSYHGSIPPESMRVEQFVRDLDEVVDLVRDRFDKDRVVLLGHSWGSAIGLLCGQAP